MVSARWRCSAAPIGRGLSAAQCAAKASRRISFGELAARREAPLGFLRHVVRIGVQAPHEEAREPRLVDHRRQQREISLAWALVDRPLAVIRPLQA
jgi:hypothetical protein